MAAWDFDDEFVRGSRAFIVGGEFFSERAGLNADDGIGTRVEGIPREKTAAPIAYSLRSPPEPARA